MQDQGEHTAQPLTSVRVLDLSGDMGVYYAKHKLGKIFGVDIKPEVTTCLSFPLTG